LPRTSTLPQSYTARKLAKTDRKVTARVIPKRTDPSQMAAGLGIERTMHVEGGPEANLSILAGDFHLDLAGSFGTGSNENDDDDRRDRLCGRLVLDPRRVARRCRRWRARSAIGRLCSAGGGTTIPI
jgi:hypothetical protein